MERFEKMKILVAYYSIHGHTQKVAQKIARILKADLEKLKDTKDRSHLTSWAKSSFDEELRTPTKIVSPENNSSNYDLVIIGTQIWDGVSPPVKAYLLKNKFKKVAFFATFGAAAENAIYYMGQLTKKSPIANLEIQDRKIDLGEDKKLIKDFCKTIKKKIK